MNHGTVGEAVGVVVWGREKMVEGGMIIKMRGWKKEKQERKTEKSEKRKIK